MKKILAGALAIVAVAAVSCTGTNGSGSEGTYDAYMDSVSTSFGSFVGAYEGANSELTPEQKEEYINAMRSIMRFRSNDATLQGAVTGAQLMNTIKMFERDRNIKLNPDAVMDAFISKFMQDSLNMMDAQRMQQEFGRMLEEAQSRAEEARLAELAAAPEAQQNVRVGNQYVEDLKAEDATIATTESGLSYKIIEAGDADKPSMNSTVSVKYVGKHINGEEFDNSNGNAVQFALRGVVRGFSEGIQLLGKGGKAVLYIPGELAYGVEGQPQAGIGPNEMLVFEVELVDFQ